MDAPRDSPKKDSFTRWKSFLASSWELCHLALAQEIRSRWPYSWGAGPLGSVAASFRNKAAASRCSPRGLVVVSSGFSTGHQQQGLNDNLPQGTWRAWFCCRSGWHSNAALRYLGRRLLRSYSGKAGDIACCLSMWPLLLCSSQRWSEGGPSTRRVVRKTHIPGSNPGF